MLKVIICGRLTKEPDFRYLEKKPDVAVTRYTIATDVGYGDNKRTEFLNCVSFGKAAEFASKYFHKGQRVLVEGTIKQGEYTNKDGLKVKTFDIVVESQEFADGVKTGETQKQGDVMDGFVSTESNADDDELPFV